MSHLREAQPAEDSIPEDNLDLLLQLSLRGDDDARDRMLILVHHTAVLYYRSKVPSEPLLTAADAWDMASESVVEFERSWSRVRKATHYCRRMFKNNLNRFLTRKRRNLRREQAMDLVELEFGAPASICNVPAFEFEQLSDEERLKVAAARDELADSDEHVQRLFAYRISGPRMTYAEIGQILGATETSLRMRMTRFNRRVRKRHLRMAQRRRLVTEREARTSRHLSRQLR